MISQLRSAPNLLTLLRLVFVLGGGMALYFGVEEFNRTAFWYWVMGFYFASFALETLLLQLVTRRQQPVGEPAASATASAQSQDPAAFAAGSPRS